MAGAAGTVLALEGGSLCRGAASRLHVPCSADLRCVQDTPGWAGRAHLRAVEAGSRQRRDQRRDALEKRALDEQRHPQDAVAVAERRGLVDVRAARAGAGSGAGRHAGAAGGTPHAGRMHAMLTTHIARMLDARPHYLTSQPSVTELGAQAHAGRPREQSKGAAAERAHR